jgi:hypothetical protein
VCLKDKINVYASRATFILSVPAKPISDFFMSAVSYILRSSLADVCLLDVNNIVNLCVFLEVTDVLRDAFLRGLI